MLDGTLPDVCHAVQLLWGEERAGISVLLEQST